MLLLLNMGFFDRIFGRKQVEEVEELPIDFNNIDNFVEKEKEIILRNTHNEIKSIYNNIDGAFNNLKQSIQKLQRAGTDKNVYISKKESQIITSNRENYLKQLSLFLEKSRLKELNYRNALEYCDLLQKDLDDISKRTAKNYHITSYIFGEAKEVAKSLKSLDDLSRNLKERIMKNKEINYVEKLDSLHQEYKEKISDKDHINNSIAQESLNEEKELDNLNEIEEKINALKKSEEFKDYSNLNDELEKMDKDLLDVKNNIIDFFSPLYRILRKFQKISIEHERLIENYINYPAETLVGDKDLEIKVVLKKLKEEILKESIKDKEEKINKIMKIIDSFNDQDIKKLRSEFSKLNNEKAKIVNKLNLLNIKKDLDNLESETKIINDRIEKIRANKEKLKLSLTTTNLDDIKDEIKTLARNRP